MKAKIVLIVSIFIGLVSCATLESDYQIILTEEFIDYGDSTLSHTLYEGSDEQFHYFIWSSGKSSGKWKISKKSMPFDCEMAYPVLEGRFMVKDDSGNFKVWGCIE